MNHLEVPRRDTYSTDIQQPLGEQTALIIRDVLAFRSDSSGVCIGPGDEVLKPGRASAPPLICEISFFSGHERHINFLKLLVGAAVPSSPSVAKGSNQGCRQASHFDKPTLLFAGKLPRSRERDGARPIMQ